MHRAESLVSNQLTTVADQSITVADKTTTVSDHGHCGCFCIINTIYKGKGENVRMKSKTLWECKKCKTSQSLSSEKNCIVGSGQTLWLSDRP